MSVYSNYFHFPSFGDPLSAWFLRWNRAILTTLFIVSASLIAFPGVAISEDVKKFKYRNEGGYVARFFVRWTTPDRITCGGYQDSSFYTSSTTKTVTVDLSDTIVLQNRFSDVKKCEARSDGYGGIKIQQGSRVWGVVEIESGDRVSCKDTKRAFFNKNGNELKYKTAGTTGNNNRCSHTN